MEELKVYIGQAEVGRGEKHSGQAGESREAKKDYNMDKCLSNRDQEERVDFGTIREKEVIGISERLYMRGEGERMGLEDRKK